MRLLSASMANFCCIGEATVELANQRLTVIQGRNKDAAGASSNASGKCFSHGTRVVMSDGTTKVVEDIRVGDTLVDPWSNVISVVETHSGIGDIYRVEHKDGRYYDVSSEHLLVLKNNSKKRTTPCRVREYEDNLGHVVIPVKDYIQLKTWEKNLLAGFVSDAITFHGGLGSVPLCPYFLGVWLGDGTTGDASVTSMDKEVIDHVYKVASDHGMVVRRYAKPLGKAATYRITSGRRTGSKAGRNEITNLLRGLGVYDCKRIPNCYLRASIQVRLQVLAGILDTDGYLNNYGFEVAIKSDDLSRDFVFLCRSLGLKCHSSKRIKSCQKGFSSSYNIHMVTGDTNLIPTRVARRQAEPRRLTHKDHRKTGIKKVTKLGSGPYFGFQTTGSQLFMLEDFTVVHNSTIIVDSICWCLFGKTTKGGSVNSVTPGGNGKGTEVKVRFEIGSDTYEVARYRKHAKYSNQVLLLKNGEDVSKATAADTEAQIQSLIGCTFETFLYTTILGQGMMFRFSQLTDQNRKEILEGIARTEIYEACRVAARKDAHAKEIAVAGATGALQQASPRVDYYLSLADAARAKQASALDDYNRRVALIDSEIQSAEVSLQEAADALSKTPEKHSIEVVVAMSSALASCDEVAREANSRRGAANYAVTAAKNQLSKLHASSNSEACDFCGSALTVDHMAAERARRTAAVDAAIANFEAADRDFNAANKRLNDARTATTAIQEHNHAADRAISIAQSRLDQATRNLDLLRSRRADVPMADYTHEINTHLQAAEAEKAKIQALQLSLKEAEADRDMSARWVDGFQDIRVGAMDSLMTFINDRLNHYCSILCGDDIAVRMEHTDKGKIDLVVTTSGGTYQSASGGEKDRIDICVAFALLALARQCTQWSTNLLVLDEVAVFVDDQGVDRLMKLVDTLLDEIESIFIISHNPVFAGYGDKAITVVKENGVSRIEND